MTPLTFYPTFVHSSYSKNLYNYHLFYYDSIHHQMFFKHNINSFIFAWKFWIKRMVKHWSKSQRRHTLKKIQREYLRCSGWCTPFCWQKWQDRERRHYHSLGQGHYHCLGAPVYRCIVPFSLPLFISLSLHVLPSFRWLMLCYMGSNKN